VKVSSFARDALPFWKKINAASFSLLAPPPISFYPAFSPLFFSRIDERIVVAVAQYAILDTFSCGNALRKEIVATGN